MRLLIALSSAAFVTLHAQTPATGRVLGRRGVTPTVNIKAYNPDGSIRFIGWDKDTVEVRGVMSSRAQLMIDGGPLGMKMGVDGHGLGAAAGRSDLVAYVPRRAMISVRTVTADITAEDVGGAFYTVSGNVRLSGHGTSFDVESMNGSLDLNVSTPWIKARTGSGHLLLRGEPQDADVSTVSGTLSIATGSVLRGQFASVSGDIHYAASPAPSAIFEFSNHSGEVDLLLPSSASAALTLSSISGLIENGFVRTRPTSAAARSIKVNLGRGEAQVTVRTFKGTIRMRPQ